MSRDASIEFVWGEGPTRFALRYGEISELCEKRKCGPLKLMRRIENEEWFIEDIYEIIRIGLIGGGAAPADAYRIAERYVKNRPALESLPAAYAIIAAGLSGSPDDPPSKKKVTRKKATTTES